MRVQRLQRAGIIIIIIIVVIIIIIRKNEGFGNRVWGREEGAKGDWDGDGSSSPREMLRHRWESPRPAAADARLIGSSSGLVSLFGVIARPR